MPKKISLLQKTTLVFFGLSLTLILLEITLRIGSFTILSLQEYRNLQSIRQKGSFRIMCLGESTTQNQYPSFLEKILNQRNIGIRFSVIDKGIGGTNTTIILSQLETNLNKYHPDMVVTMMGVNDGRTHMPYEINSTSKTISILKSLKVYKLAKLLWLHMTTKFKEVTKRQDSIQQEQLSKKVVELNPKNDNAYVELGMCYNNQGKLADAEQAFKDAIELNPKNETAHNALGSVYKRESKFTEAEQLFKKAIGLNPNNETVYIELGRLYIDQSKFTEAEQLFKKAIRLNPNNNLARQDLGWFYIYQQKYIKAEQLFKKAIEFNPNNEVSYGCLATIYSEMGNSKLSRVYAKKADSLRDKYYNPMTTDNYHKLKRILDKRNIKLVCVQYPMRNIEPLKRIFEEAGGIIFVDNEKIFEDAVKKTNCKEYFRDMFGGDFGHCTDKGNNLLAGNIADTILKEVFGK